MKTFQIQKISLTLLTFNKIQTKLLPFKTRIVPIITKNLKIKDFVEYKVLGSNGSKALIIKRAGKVSGKYSDWYNIKNANDDTISSID